MKYAHLIKLSVFSYEGENSQAIQDAFAQENSAGFAQTSATALFFALSLLKLPFYFAFTFVITTLGLKSILLPQYGHLILFLR